MFWILFDQKTGNSVVYAVVLFRDLGRFDKIIDVDDKSKNE